MSEGRGSSSSCWQTMRVVWVSLSLQCWALYIHVHLAFIYLLLGPCDAFLILIRCLKDVARLLRVDKPRASSECPFVCSLSSLYPCSSSFHWYLLLSPCDDVLILVRCLKDVARVLHVDEPCASSQWKCLSSFENSTFVLIQCSLIRFAWTLRWFSYSN